MKRLLTSVGAMLAGIMLTTGVASAVSAFNNGSFETGNDPGSYTTLTAPDSTSITGWTVSSGTIDYIGTYWNASDGKRSLDMSGNGPGAINQVFSTIAGHTYTVTFDMAGNPDGAPTIKTMNVDTGSTPKAYSFDSTGATHTNMGWQQMVYNFTANAASTTLTFTSTTNSPYGPALDNVALKDVLQNVEQCEHGGWMAYSNPSFSSQRECEKYIEARAYGNLELANPHQRIKFNLANQSSKSDNEEDDQKVNTVEYWNYDYPGGTLNYKADVTCTNINPTTKEVRFVFQIPSGHTGLSGLYVLAYAKDADQKGVKDGTNDLYGHTSTSNQAAANAWCQTGAGFTPTMYQITDGKVEVDD
jgi:choice-of-anchor C domain-containing protein